MNDMTHVALSRGYRDALAGHQETLEVPGGRLHPYPAPSGPIAAVHASISFLLHYKEGQHPAQAATL